MLRCPLRERSQRSRLSLGATLRHILYVIQHLGALACGPFQTNILTLNRTAICSVPQLDQEPRACQNAALELYWLLESFSVSGINLYNKHGEFDKNIPWTWYQAVVQLRPRSGCTTTHLHSPLSSTPTSIRSSCFCRRKTLKHRFENYEFNKQLNKCVGNIMYAFIILFNRN